MGRYSDSEEEYKRSKKKKKKRSRSRSRSSESSYASYSSNSKKHKKSKKKKSKKVRSRSISPDRRYRRSRSRTPGSRRQSRSPRRRAKSRSWSPRRSRSRSRGRYRSKSRSPRFSRKRSRSRSWSRPRRRSRSPSYRRSRSRSYSRSKRSRSRSVEKIKKERLSDDKDPSKMIPGWDDMTPSEQAEARLQLAIKAAASVDENLRVQGVLPFSNRKLGSGSNSPMLYDEHFNRSKAVSEIESSGFAPSTFKSSRSVKNESSDLNDIHDSAIFGGEIKLGAAGEMPILSKSKQPLKNKDTESLMHPNLYVSAEEKMDRWIEKLKAFRRSKIEGEAIK